LKARTILWAACALALVGALALYGLSRTRAQEGASPRTASASGTARVGGPFQLVDQSGAARDQTLLTGRWSVVFFGFTYCPDICPTTLQTLGAAKGALGPAGEGLQLVFVTVDPERDTPGQLNTYLESDAFPPGVVGLTGTAEQVRAATRAYGVYYAREGIGDGYRMEHTSLLYLMDPQGRFSRILRLEGGPEGVARQIRTAMDAGPGGNVAAS